MTPMESVLEFILRRLTTNELSTVRNYLEASFAVVLLGNFIYQCLSFHIKFINA